jgi:hypothetical protein
MHKRASRIKQEVPAPETGSVDQHSCRELSFLEELHAGIDTCYPICHPRLEASLPIEENDANASMKKQGTLFQVSQILTGVHDHQGYNLNDKKKGFGH